jgi:hypothetical protein
LIFHFLYRSEIGTKKCQDAIAKGVDIVDEEWVRSRISGGDENEPKKSKSSKAAPPLVSHDLSLSGKCFAISGTLSVTRADFEKFITSNGGTIAKSVNKSCTHLVTSETGTKKCQNAEDKGVEIVDEDWVRSVVAGTNESDENAGSENGDGSENDEEEDRNPGEDVDITGEEISLGEPPYKRSFLKKITRRGTQYRHLEAGGDWEAWLEDLVIILPSLTKLTKVTLQIPQSGCDGLIDVLKLVNDIETIEECDFSNSFEDEPMDVIRSILLSHPKLTLLDVTADCSENEANERLVVSAIGQKYGQDYQLKSFKGFDLWKDSNLQILEFTESQIAGIESEDNSVVLRMLKERYGSER